MRLGRTAHPFLPALVIFPALCVALAGGAQAGCVTASKAPLFGGGFIENRGQLDSSVLYYATGSGSIIYLMRDAIVLDRWEDLRPAGEIAPRTKGMQDERTEAHRRGRSVWIRFDSAPGPLAVEAADRTEPHMNFFFGNDPAGWRTDVPVFRTVEYGSVWPGIDLSLTMDAGRIFCAARAAQGADLTRARFLCAGMEGADGEVLLRELTGADLFGGMGTSGERDGGETAPSLDLPGRLLWSTFLGGTSEEIGWSVALDQSGNPILTGLTISSAFPTTPGAYDRVYSGLGDVFISKLSADGSAVLWSTFLGGSEINLDYGYAITVGASDDPIVTGYTWSADFPTTPGAYDRSQNGMVDAFVAKLSADGSTLLWSTFLGGEAHDIGYSLDLDTDDNPVVAGRTASYQFPVTFDSYDPYWNGEEDVFVTKLSKEGDAILWSTFVGGGLYDGASSIKLGTMDAPIVVGYTASSDFPGDGFVGGLYDVFACKLKPGGDALAWSHLFGGSSYDFANDVALDESGNPILCGATGSPDFPVTPGAYDTSYNGDDDAYVMKLDGASGLLSWSTFLGGSAPVYETAFGIGVDAADRPVVTGSTPSTDFPVTAQAYDQTHNGASDVFVASFDASGSVLEWSSFLGGSGDDYGFALVLDDAGQAISVGCAGAEDFPTTETAYDRTYNGDISDVFAAKLDVTVDPAAAPESETESGKPPVVSCDPNPLRDGAALTITLPEASLVSIAIFDVSGRAVRSLLDRRYFEIGSHRIEWKDDCLAPGVYFARLSAQGARGEWRKSLELRVVR